MVWEWRTEEGRIVLLLSAKTSGASPDKRRKYAAAFKAEALRLAGESRSTKAAARQLSSKRNSWLKWAAK